MSIHNVGKPIEVSEHLLPVKKPAHPPVTPRSAAEIDLSDIRKRLNRSDNELVHRILAGEPLASPGGRDNAVNSAMGSIAFTLQGAPWESIREICRVSIASMGDDEPWLDLAEEKYSRALAAYADKKDEERAKSEAARRAFGAVATPSGGGAQRGLEPEEGLDLITRPTKEGPVVVACPENAVRILRTQPIRLNTLTRTVEISGGPLAGVNVNTLSLHAAGWLHSVYNINLASAKVKEALALVATENAYNPVEEYLNSLTWDGTKRIDTWLTDYMRADPDDEYGQDVTDYNRIISRKFLISAVARAMDPGCKVDTTLILSGPQGTGKTTCFEILAGDWYVSCETTAGDKDSRLLAIAGWIVELAELASFHRADRNSVKAFLSSRQDKFRPPYGDAIEVFPRRNVFVGTTNEDHYLSDPTGNRRYLPVKCSANADLVGLARDRDHLWAEAVHAYKSGEAWHSEGAEFAMIQARVDGMVPEQVQDEATEIRIREWWGRLSVEKRMHMNETKAFTTVYVATKVLNLDIEKMDQHALFTRVGKALTRLGFLRRRSNTRYYVAPAAWLTLPVTGQSADLKKELDRSASS